MVEAGRIPIIVGREGVALTLTISRDQNNRNIDCVRKAY